MIDELTDELIRFIETQPMFFVATAAPEGRVNVSPKGMDSLRVLGPGRIVWLNLTGSGNETAAHVAVSQRMTLMFMSITANPMIVRVFGSARTIHPRDSDGTNSSPCSQHSPDHANSSTSPSNRYESRAAPGSRS
jgi:Pyridoxamine 5'-phosphate oxidase